MSEKNKKAGTLKEACVVTQVLFGASYSDIVLSNLDTGTAQLVAFPREKWDEVKMREDLNLKRLGFYLLAGSKKPNGQALYVGQTSIVFKRIKQHIAHPRKRYWNHAICCLCNTDTLNRAYIEYLEWKTYQRALGIPSFILKNDRIPVEPKLSLSDKITADKFFSDVLLLIDGLKIIDL